MIDLEKEREAFEAGKQSDPLAFSNYGDFVVWLKRAELAQAEITELKQKLEKLESGEFVLVPKKELSTWYLDEYEGLWLDRDGIDAGLSQIDVGQVVEVKKQKQYSIELPNTFIALPWLNEEVGYWQEYSTKEEAEKVAKHCKQMFEAVEKEDAQQDS